MSYTRGIVPKYLVIYSLAKVLVALRDMSGGSLKKLGHTGCIAGIAKCFLSVLRILGLKHIRSKWLYNLMVASIVFEACLFFYERKYLTASRIAAEIVFGLLSCGFVLFFQPFYCQDIKVGKNREKSS